MRDNLGKLDAVVSIDGASPVTLTPMDQLAFGRDAGNAVTGIAPNDTGVSRRCGRLAFRSESWWIENQSEKRDLFVEYPDVVEWATVPPRGSHTLTGTCTVLVVGNVFTHAIRVRFSPPYSAQFMVTLPETAETEDQKLYTQADKTALAALAEGYLRRWPRHNPSPHSYADAAALLSWDEVTLRRRLENLRDRLAKRGVADLSGPHSSRLLAEFAIRRGVIAVADLSRLARGGEEASA